MRPWTGPRGMCRRRRESVSPGGPQAVAVAREPDLGLICRGRVALIRGPVNAHRAFTAPHDSLARWLGPNGQVAQLVEQRIENPRVGSSILPLATSENSGMRFCLRSAYALGFQMVPTPGGSRI